MTRNQNTCANTVQIALVSRYAALYKLRKANATCTLRYKDIKNSNTMYLFFNKKSPDQRRGST